MYSKQYLRQVAMLLQCLPAISRQEKFALMGGTAINYFVLNMPRLSVDIDLKYLPIEDRKTSLLSIETGLEEIIKNIQHYHPEYKVKPVKSRETNTLYKVNIYHENIMVKIEVNTVKRGVLFPIRHSKVNLKVSDVFEIYPPSVPVLTEAELYAGKICAALSRQHPRDLFDIHLLLNNGKITPEIQQAFVCYLASDSRPIHELLAPNLIDIRELFNREFKQMTETSITIETLIDAREQLIRILQQSLTKNERQFLLSIKKGEPNYELMPFPQLINMPGLQWKLINIKQMDKAKRAKMLNKLRDVLKL